MILVGTKTYLVVIIFISKGESIICGTGNCSLWYNVLP